MTLFDAAAEEAAAAAEEALAALAASPVRWLRANPRLRAAARRVPGVRPAVAAARRRRDRRQR